MILNCNETLTLIVIRYENDYSYVTLIECSWNQCSLNKNDFSCGTTCS